VLKPQPHQTPRFFRIAQMIGIIGVSLLVINFFYQLITLHEKNIAHTALSTCNLQAGSCTKQLPDQQQLTIRVSPTPMTPNQPIDTTVSVKGMNPEQVALLLFPYPAKGSPSKPTLLSKNSEGLYTGTFVLTPSATEDKQEWIALVIVKAGSKEISVPFKFYVLPAH
jgi:hypothetical protein